MSNENTNHEEAYELNRLNWDERVDSHFNSPMYQAHIEDLKKGKHCMDPVLVERMGDVTGKKLIHLQCHMGMETLAWAQLGAESTGIDFSQPAIDRGRLLSAELNIPAEFICTDLYSTPDHVEANSFDIAFVSVGAILWLPDINEWASVVSKVLKPGGKLFMDEVHPLNHVLEQHDTEPILYAKYPYLHDAPLVFDEQGSYTDESAIFEHTKTLSWTHSISAVINALISNGLTIRAMHETAKCVWKRYESMTEVNPSHFELPDPYTGKLPMLYTLIAEKQ